MRAAPHGRDRRRWARRARRRTAAASVLALTGLCLAACGPSHPKPSPSRPSFSGTEAAMVQCLLGKHLIPRRQVQGKPWLINGHVYGDSALAIWVFNHEGTVYGGKTLHEWATAAERHWPTSFCGAKPSIPPPP